MKVRDVYEYISNKYGANVASKFYNLMAEWDGSKNVLSSFYNKDVLDMKLNEALEATNYKTKNNSDLTNVTYIIYDDRNFKIITLSNYFGLDLVKLLQTNPNYSYVNVTTKNVHKNSANILDKINEVNNTNF